MELNDTFYNFLKRYFAFLYSKDFPRVVHIATLKKAKGKSAKKSEKTSLSLLKFRIGLIVTYTLTFLIIISFVGIIVYSFFLPDQETPTILRDTFIALLGYFGGTFTAFVKLDDGKEYKG